MLSAVENVSDTFSINIRIDPRRTLTSKIRHRYKKSHGRLVQRRSEVSQIGLSKCALHTAMHHAAHQRRGSGTQTNSAKPSNIRGSKHLRQPLHPRSAIQDNFASYAHRDSGMFRAGRSFDRHVTSRSMKHQKRLEPWREGQPVSHMLRHWTFGGLFTLLLLACYALLIVQ